MSGLIRFGVVGSVLIMVAGCGGGSGAATAGGGGSSNTTVTFTFQGAAPTAAATKIGSGNYTQQTPTSGKLTLTIPNGTTSFAVAYFCPRVQVNSLLHDYLTEEYVFEATTADGTEFTSPSCASQQVPYSGQTGLLSGSVNACAIPGVCPALVQSGYSVDVLNGDIDTVSGGPNPGVFQVQAPVGTSRVEVKAYVYQTNNLAAARNFPNQSVPGTLAGGNEVTLGASDETTPQTISYANVPSGYSVPTTDVYFNMGVPFPRSLSGGRSPLRSQPLAGEFDVTVGATAQYPGLPATAIASGDFYDSFARATNNQNNNEAINIEQTSTAGGLVNFTFPPPWTYAGPTPAALPTFNLNYAGFSGKTGVVQVASVGTAVNATTYNETVSSTVIATLNYQNGSTTLTFPDLSGLTGFLPAWASGTSLYWAAGVSQSSVSVFQPLPANASVVTVSNGGGFTVP